tara:strand:- start:398 stop:526 length:129 start_codon:yes stop_codon:yes gene_type:complete
MNQGAFFLTVLVIISPFTTYKAFSAFKKTKEQEKADDKMSKE